MVQNIAFQICFLEWIRQKKIISVRIGQRKIKVQRFEYQYIKIRALVNKKQ